MNETELENARKVIRLTLIKIGLRCDLIGFEYLCYAAELVIQDPSLIHCLCKNLYVQIGEKFGVKKDHCVERSIRHVIDNTYINKGFSGLNKLFGANLYTIDDKPTVGELIHLVSEYYSLNLYKKDMPELQFAN